ncbi:MAG: PrsW family intramembrane metalloprotease [Chloroflexota bacterium]|nr:MAG: PrsW family intramembrane metalloprotease [Chloroflexota bacterium]
MLQQMLGFLINFFAVNPDILEMLLAWFLALIFGAIWLACYRPPLLAKPWLWAVLAGGAILAPIAIAITAYPLSSLISLVLGSVWSRETLLQWAMLASVPSMYLYALVREGFKLVPVVIYWWRNGRNIEPKLGLAAGAVSGAGFSILESQWTLNYIFASGWSWENVQMYGLVALGGFWETFFVLGTQIASCALAGWGLAKGWGWQFYLLGAFVYFFSSYSYVLMSKELITGVQAEFFIAAWALIATGVVLWLREKKSQA